MALFSVAAIAGVAYLRDDFYFSVSQKTLSSPVGDATRTRTSPVGDAARTRLLPKGEASANAVRYFIPIALTT